MKAWNFGPSRTLEIFWNREFRFDWYPKVERSGRMLTVQFLYWLIFYEWGRTAPNPNAEPLLPCSYGGGV